jgi:hypothetical protein
MNMDIGCLRTEFRGGYGDHGEELNGEWMKYKPRNFVISICSWHHASDCTVEEEATHARSKNAFIFVGKMPLERPRCRRIDSIILKL